MTRRGFLDTNVLVYAFTDDPRAARAEVLLGSGCITGVQALNEFANVARRKLRFDWDEVRDALTSIRALCHAIVPMDINLHDDGIRIARRHRIGVFDAMMIAAALRSECDILWSEDMHDGLIVEERVRIENPFKAA